MDLDEDLYFLEDELTYDILKKIYGDHVYKLEITSFLLPVGGLIPCFIEPALIYYFLSTGTTPPPLLPGVKI